MFLADNNAPEDKKKQVAASLNYRKRKDREETRVEGKSTSGEARVEGESTSGEARVEGESTTGEARVEGESTSGEARVEGESTSGLQASGQLVMTVKNKTQQ